MIFCFLFAMLLFLFLFCQPRAFLFLLNTVFSLFEKKISSGSSTQGVDGAGVGDGVGKGVVGDGKVVVGDGVGKGVVGDGVGKGVSTILNISEPLRRSLEKVFLFGNNSFNSAVSVTLNHSATPFQNPSLKKKSSSEYHQQKQQQQQQQ